MRQLLAAIAVFLLYSSIFIVNEREQAIVLRFGEIQDVKEEPGIYFKAPLAFAGVDNVQIIEDRKLTLDLEDIRVQVSGGIFRPADALVQIQAGEPLVHQRVDGADAVRLLPEFQCAV